MAANNAKRYIDLLTALPFGANSGVAPLLLPSQQAAWAINTTFRGGYATDRPPVQKLTLNFGGNAELETAVRKGFFQGAGVYRPDFGSSQNVAQIGGRLFTFTENGDVWDVVEITIPGDPNDATTNQVWMWQAEKWLIISDGTSKLPIFYDGVSCRRSYGPSYTIVPVGGISASSPGTVPAVNSSVTLTLVSPYTGPFNVPVRFNGALYQPSGSITGNITLTNISGTPGAVHPVGSDVVVNPNLIGATTASATASSTLIGTACVIPAFCGTNFNISITLPLTSVGSLAVGNAVTFTSMTGLSLSWTVQSISGLNVTLTRVWGVTIFGCSVCTPSPPPSMTQFSANAGTLVQFSSSMGPNVVLGQLTAAFNNPSVGSTANGSLSTPYTGPANQLVTIGTSLYTLNAIPASGGTSLILINLTDNEGDAYPAMGTLDITSVPELPACRMGVYGMGQNWFSAVDGLSFGCSDLVGSSSGTPANNYRDAVLKTNDLEVMGYFHLPNAGEIITSMTFVATLDQALGQGPLQVGVASGMFSCKAPFTLIDFQGTSLVEAIANPILTKSLIGFGPVAQNSTVLANSDTIFRSYEGINSLILARRDFSDLGGNTPISREVTRALENDNQSLLSYSSAIVFDNRLRMTCYPTVSGQGVFHQGEAVLNYDLLSSLRGKAQPVWDGLWTGLNILQYTQGLFGPVSRAFAFTFNITDTQIELYELLPTGREHFDNGNIRIKWVVETPVIFNQNIKPLTDLARLIDGEMYLTEVNERVDVNVQYRPLFYPCWRPWHEFSICADMTTANAKEQVRYALGFGETNPKDCDPINDRPFRDAEAFQLRLEFTGHAKLWGVKCVATELPTPAFTAPVCKPLCLDVPSEPDVPVTPDQIPNEEVRFCKTCDEGYVLNVSGTLPAWITLDDYEGCLVGMAGAYFAATQAAANELAQNAINAVGAAMLVCEQQCPEITVLPANLLDGVLDEPYTDTCSASGGASPYTFSVIGGALPDGLTLASDGEISGTPTAGGTFDFTIAAVDTNGCSGNRAYSMMITCADVVLSPTSLPDGVLGVAYSETISASGGTAPYTFSVSAGSLPTGLSLATDGSLTGTPTIEQTANFTVTALDADGCPGQRAYSITTACPTITLSPGTLPNGSVGDAYSETISASGGTAPYTFAVTSGTLPEGLSLASDGTLSGTPITADDYTFVVEATDDNGCTGSLSYDVTITAGGLDAQDDMESYANGAAVNGLNGGSGFSGAYVDR